MVSMPPGDEGTDATASPVDFDLHGIVGIRLLGARAHDIAVVERQLGPIRRPLHRPADIEIHFVRRLPAEPVTYVSLNESGFTEEGFYLHRGHRASPVRVQVALDQSHPLRLVVEHGAPAVPLLVPLVNVVAADRGAVAVHGAAFVHRGRGVLVVGWSKGGKTETLLSFMALGAEYVGDEWVYLRPEDRTIFGLPEPMRVWGWQLRQLPQFSKHLPTTDRVRVGGLSMSHGVADGVFRRRHHGRPPGGAIAQGLALLARQTGTRVPPAALFGQSSCRTTAPLDRVVLVLSSEDEEVSVQRTEAAEIARRMCFSLHHERSSLLDTYDQYRFAFPGRSNAMIDQASALEADVLTRALTGVPAFVLRHPYPVQLHRLADTLAPAIEAEEP